MSHLHLPRVIVDVDGVLRDFIGSLTRIYQREHPDHQVLPVTSRDLENFFPIGEGIYDFFDRHFADEILEDAPALPGAIEALQRWQDKFQIVIASSQPPSGIAPTLIWLGRHNVPAREIHIIDDKHTLSGVAILEDFVDNLEAFEATGRLAVCLDQPWNLHWTGPRVNSVDEFFRLVYQELQDEANHTRLA